MLTYFHLWKLLITSEFPHSKYSTSCHLVCLFATSARLAEQSNILSATFQNTTRTSLVNQPLVDSCTQFGITLAGGCLCVSSRRTYLMHPTLCICTCWRYSQDRFHSLTLALLTFVGYLLEPLTFSSCYLSWLLFHWYINNEEPPLIIYDWRRFMPFRVFDSLGCCITSISTTRMCCHWNRLEVVSTCFLFFNPLTSALLVS